MADMTALYMGLKLQSPLILGSSTLSKNIEFLKAVENEGAGAVVLKSLFEEELLPGEAGYGESFRPDLYEHIMKDALMVYGTKGYIDKIENTKRNLKIPVIASINCLGGKWWTDFTRNIEKAGADALELNISYIPFSVKDDPRAVEDMYINTVKAVKSKLKIPVSVKISDQFTSIPYMAQRLKEAGADGLTLFNRYYKMGIDTNTMMFTPIHTYSQETETYNNIRWVSAVTSQVDIDVCSSTGIHTSSAAIQHILAGASAFQIVSEVHKGGLRRISSILEDIKGWLEMRKKKSVSEIKGLASKKNIGEHAGFERNQYMKVAEAKFLR
jgi:dihydroorotate dehydrogenase (fumarate)